MFLSRGVFRGGGLWGLSPLGPVESMNFRGFSGPDGLEIKCLSPLPGQIPEYAPDVSVLELFSRKTLINN